MDLVELKAGYQRLQLLYEISNVIHSTLDPQKALELVLQRAVRVMQASSGSIVLINPTSGLLEIEASTGLPAACRELKLRVGQGITGWVARTGKPARVGQVEQDPRYVMLRPEVRSELAVPLEVGGELRGVINIDSEREGAFSAADQALLEALAAQSAKVIHSTWLYEQLRLKARMLETLVSVSQTINSQLNLTEVLQVITREACMLMEAKMCSLMLLDASGKWLDLRASFGAGPVYIAKPRLSLAESFLGTVVRRKKPSQLENVQSSGPYQNANVARQEGLVSLAAAPLIFGAQAIGTLNVYTGQTHSFSNEQIHILCALAELSAIAIEKARLYERIVDAEEQLRRNEKLSALGLLAAEVAHEIRNPLTVMKMLYHSLALEFQPGDPRAKDDAILREKMDQLNRTVEQILDFARSTEPKPTPVNINEVLEDLTLLTRHKLKNQSIEFSLQLAPGLPVLMADRTQLGQAFLNLTLNAVQAMPNGGKLTISSQPCLRSGSCPSHVLIEFKDTGKGMSPQEQNHAFSSLLSTTKAQGTGLGLAIVSRVVETHSGELQIRSVPGKGTVIGILLPVSQE